MTNQLSILAADDDPAFLGTIVEIFDRHSLQVTPAKNGRIAAELIATMVNLRLVITDQNMPEMSGAEVLRIVRATRPTTLRVLMSAEIGHDADFDTSLREQCDPHELVKKPVPLSFFTGLISRMRLEV